MVTPRQSCAPCSRNAGRSTSSSSIAAPIPTATASWPSDDANVPSWPVRCSATARSSKARVRVIAR